MLEKHGVTCDGCGTYHHYECKQWRDRIPEIKREGWTIRKIPNIDAFYHHCPDCEIPKVTRQQRNAWYEND